MVKKNQKLLNGCSMFLDFILVFASYYMAVWIRFDLLAGSNKQYMLGTGKLLESTVYAGSVVFFCYLLKVYSPQRKQKIGAASLQILLANTTLSFGRFAFYYLQKDHDISRIAILLHWMLASVLLVGKHIAVKAFLHYFRRYGYNLKHVIVVGNGTLARQYMEAVRNNPQMGYCVDGYISAVEKPGLGVCLGCYETLNEVIEARKIDEIIVALEPHEVHFMEKIISAADQGGIGLMIIPFFNSYIPSHPTIDTVDNVKLINMRATPLDSYFNSFIKRSFDIVFSLICILLTSPIMLITAIAVKCSSPGPIFFVQNRVGRGNKNFKMLKFRSMRVNSAEDTGWSRRDDPRKTRVGEFIRKYSIDELPQFFNVLKGDMSIVGPRPEIPFHVRHFKEEISLYLIRQQVRPGITGWAQVNGLRGNTSIEDRVKYDIRYIENWSFGLDLKIICKTVLGGFINREENCTV